MNVWVTGACGLIGSAVSDLLCRQGHTVLGIDNDARAEYFGPEASTRRMGTWLSQEHPRFEWVERDILEIDEVLTTYGPPEGVVHCAAQPSHDKAVQIAIRDYRVNAEATVRLLELLRRAAPEVVFVHLSTNKVYGDKPNELRLRECETRWEPADMYGQYAHGFDETLSIDQSTHSLFGASKLCADIYVQEYGRYFGMWTVSLRGGCLTGSAHMGAELHGFLQYLAKCVHEDREYTVYGFKGKQVRDNIHASDVATLVLGMLLYPPKPGSVFNVGGGLNRSISVLEAISMFEALSGKSLKWEYDHRPRRGDHQWYVTDTSKVQAMYPSWIPQISLEAICEDIWRGLVNG